MHRYLKIKRYNWKIYPALSPTFNVHPKTKTFRLFWLVNFVLFYTWISIEFGELRMDEALIKVKNQQSWFRKFKLRQIYWMVLNLGQFFRDPKFPFFEDFTSVSKMLVVIFAYFSAAHLKLSDVVFTQSRFVVFCSLKACLKTKVVFTRVLLDLGWASIRYALLSKLTHQISCIFRLIFGEIRISVKFSSLADFQSNFFGLSFYYRGSHILLLAVCDFVIFNFHIRKWFSS